MFIYIICTYIYIFKYPDCVGHLFLCIGPILECGFKSSFISLKCIYLLSPWSYQLWITSRLGMGFWVHFSSSILCFILCELEKVLSMLSVTEFTCATFLLYFGYTKETCFLEVIPLSGYFVLSVPSSIIQSLICKVCDIGIQFRPEYSKSFHFLYIFLWWISVILWLLIDFTVVILVWFFLKSRFIF